MTGNASSQLSVPSKVDIIQYEMSQLPQQELGLEHRFTPGLYIRELHAPAGTMLVTKIHKTEHPFIFLRGKMSVWTEEDGVKQMEGPILGITKPGTRRVAYAHTDCTWITFHPTEEVDLVKIEDQLIEPRDVALELSNSVYLQLKEAT